MADPFISQSKTFRMGSANPGNSRFLPGETPLGRQGSSLYSLTFDELQNALGEPGKDFGSMNMDELLRNIWTAQESQAMAAAMSTLEGAGVGLASQVSLQQQGSLALPRTLSRRTVEEVWKNIQQEGTDGTGIGGPAAGQQRQITFGEMTLEDFLVKAGVAREEPTNQTFISFGGNAVFVGADDDGVDRVDNRRGFFTSGVDGSIGTQAGVASQLTLSPANVLAVPSSIDGMRFDALQNQVQQGDWINSDHGNVIAQQQQQLFQQHAAVEAASSYANATKVVGNGLLVGAPLGVNPGPLSASGLDAAMCNEGLGISFVGGTGFTGHRYGAVCPVSPTSDGTAPHQSNLPLSLAQYGLNGQVQGRKRCAEGPVERVIERRQRRMIKNRESAARSRARKQAYTVELEAEVSELKEENLKLLGKQEEEAERRKKQILAVMPPSTQKVGGRGWALRRTRTGPW